MTTLTAHAQAAVDTIATITGVNLTATPTSLAVDGTDIPLPIRNAGGTPELKGSYGNLLGIKGALPTVPQGDDRDRLLWWIVSEARSDGAEQTALLRDQRLSRDLPNRLGFSEPDANEVVAEAIKDRFFSAKTTRNLKPMHSSLPMNYAYRGVAEEERPARYRTFSGEIIVFLLNDPRTGTTDRDLLADLLSFFDTEDDLTAIDRLFIEEAMKDVPYPQTRPSAEALIAKYEPGTQANLAAANGVFCPASLDLFRRDLRTVLDTPLPKPDKVQWLTLLLSLHLASRMYRLALIKGNELDQALAAASDTAVPTDAKGCACEALADETDPESLPTCLLTCPLAGAIKFRTGSGRYRPIARKDPARDSYVRLDQWKLLALPAVLVTTNLALRAWTALGGPAHEGATAADLAVALRADPNLKSKFNAACAAIAALHHSAHRPNAPEHALLRAAGIDEDRSETPGLVALRDSVLQRRRTDLRHQSRDVLNQLLLDHNAAAGGSLVSRNGTHTFYETDERMTVLLVRLVCHNGPQSYDDFLEGISAYGLAPQNAAERSALADSLERLGLLVRYSDAGEASFVHYN